jgi:hypothetical protein
MSGGTITEYMCSNGFFITPVLQESKNGDGQVVTTLISVICNCCGSIDFPEILNSQPHPVKQDILIIKVKCEDVLGFSEN